MARSLFAERGYEATSIEEIAQRAGVSKPVVYEHFGGKEGLYAVVVDREMSVLLDGITSSLTSYRSRVRLEQVALALLSYIEERTDGFRILIRDSPPGVSSGTYSSLLNDAVSQVSSILAGDFQRRGLDAEMAPLYAQALVGQVSMTAQWWLDAREPKKGSRCGPYRQPVLAWVEAPGSRSAAARGTTRRAGTSAHCGPFDLTDGS